MAELQLEVLEGKLFDAGIECKRDYDDYEEHDYLRVYNGTEHVDLSPLWSAPTTGDDDEYFFDGDDLHGVLYRDGQVDCEFDLYADDVDDLVAQLEQLFEEGVDSLS